MGGGHHQAFGDTTTIINEGGSNPWRDQSNTPLAHDLGVDDIGRSDNSRAGLLDQASNDGYDRDEMDLDADDFGGNDDSGSDYA